MVDIRKDLTKDEKEETKILGEHFSRKRHSVSELTKDEKKEPKLEKQFARLAKKSRRMGGKKRKIRTNRIILPIIIILLIILFIYFMKDVGGNEISIIVIKDNECGFCTDADSIVEMIGEEIKIISIEEYDYRDENAKGLIEKTNIKTVPSIIIKGKGFSKTEFFKNLPSTDIEISTNRFVISNFKPPFTNIENNEILGIVDVTYIKDEPCTECADLNHMINRFKDLGVYIGDIKEVEIGSVQGNELKEKYRLEKAPILIFDSNLGLYSYITGNWELYGSIEDDGIMIMRRTLPPYRDLGSGEIKGSIKPTYIIDKTCTECYDPKIHKEEIVRIMPYYREEEILDVSEAQELIDKYKIENIPTMILSKDVEEYILFESFFGNVYEKQGDGSYVFKANHQLTGMSYKDLKTGEIITN